MNIVIRSIVTVTFHLAPVDTLKCLVDIARIYIHILMRRGETCAAQENMPSAIIKVPDELSFSGRLN